MHRVSLQTINMSDTSASGCCTSRLQDLHLRRARLQTNIYHASASRMLQDAQLPHGSVREPFIDAAAEAADGSPKILHVRMRMRQATGLQRS